MATIVKTEKELADALKREDDTIEITGDLAAKTIKIRATGTVAWAVAIGAIGLAACALISIPATGGADTPAAAAVSGLMAPVAVVSLGGVAVAWTAITIAVFAGGVNVLKKLRNYKEISRGDSVLVLEKKY